MQRQLEPLCDLDRLPAVDTVAALEPGLSEPAPLGTVDDGVTQRVDPREARRVEASRVAPFVAAVEEPGQLVDGFPSGP